MTPFSSVSIVAFEQVNVSWGIYIQYEHDRHVSHFKAIIKGFKHIIHTYQILTKIMVLMMMMMIIIITIIIILIIIIMPLIQL